MRAGGASLYDKIQELAPRNDLQRSLQGQALQIGFDLGRMRSLLLEQAGSSIPTPILVAMVFWLAVIFTSFGLFAPCQCNRHRYPVRLRTIGFRCNLLILELDSPFAGLMQISDLPLRNALAVLGN